MVPHTWCFFSAYLTAFPRRFQKSPSVAEEGLKRGVAAARAAPGPGGVHFDHVPVIGEGATHDIVKLHVRGTRARAGNRRGAADEEQWSHRNQRDICMCVAVIEDMLYSQHNALIIIALSVLSTNATAVDVLSTNATSDCVLRQRLSSARNRPSRSL